MTSEAGILAAAAVCVLLEIIRGQIFPAERLRRVPKVPDDEKKPVLSTVQVYAAAVSPDDGPAGLHADLILMVTVVDNDGDLGGVGDGQRHAEAGQEVGLDRGRHLPPPA